MDAFALLGLVTTLVTVTAVVGLITRAVLRYQDRQLRGTESPDMRAELEALRAQVTDQQDLRQRVLDMEERLDFAERVLTQAKQDQLSPGNEPRP